MHVARESLPSLDIALPVTLLHTRQRLATYDVENLRIDYTMREALIGVERSEMIIYNRDREAVPAELKRPGF
jgi:hypothetical protein